MEPKNMFATKLFSYSTHLTTSYAPSPPHVSNPLRPNLNPKMWLLPIRPPPTHFQNWRAIRLNFSQIWLGPCPEFFPPPFFQPIGLAQFSPQVNFSTGSGLRWMDYFLPVQFRFFSFDSISIIWYYPQKPSTKNSNLTYTPTTEVKTPTTEVFFACFRCMDLANFEIRVRKISNLLYHETWKVSSVADFFGLSYLHVLFTKKNSLKNYC